MSLYFAILSASDRFSNVISVGNSIVGLVAILILHVIITGAHMIAVKGSAKRSKSKIRQEYPYFQHGIFYKTFFLGLNGKIPKSIVVLSFIINIACILYIPIMIWNCVMPHVVPSTIMSVLLGIFFITICTRGLIFIFTDFKL